MKTVGQAQDEAGWMVLREDGKAPAVDGIACQMGDVCLREFL